MDEKKENPPRVRLAKHIDLSKADPVCSRCDGTGRRGFKEVETPDGKIKAPVICRCVSRNNGVKQDALDKVSAEVEKQLKEGTFSASLAADIKSLPLEHRITAIRGLREQANNKEKPDNIRLAMNEAIALVYSSEIKA